MAGIAVPAGGMRAARWTWRAAYTVVLLGVVAGVQMSDRGLQAILLGAIQTRFGVGDAAVGALQGLAGVLIGSAGAVPLARLGDLYPRRRVLIGIVLAWGLLMAASALAPDFTTFFAARAATGVTEFALIPIVYSMIPDLAPAGHRVPANLVFAGLMAAGASAGFYLGGAIVALAATLPPDDLETWRKAMLLLASAALPLAAASLVAVEPPRLAVAADPAATGLAPFLRERWRAVGLFVGVAGSLMIAVQAVNPLIALALERRFAAGADRIGHALGVVTLVASVGCLPVAGLLDRGLRRRFGERARPLAMGLGAAAAAPFACAIGLAPGLDPALVAVAGFLMLTAVANALVPTRLQDLTPASLRVRSFAVWSFVVSIFSAAGPLVVGALSQLAMHGRLLTAISMVATVAALLTAVCAARSFAAAGPSAG